MSVRWRYSWTRQTDSSLEVINSTWDSVIYSVCALSWEASADQSHCWLWGAHNVLVNDRQQIIWFLKYNYLYYISYFFYTFVFSLSLIFYSRKNPRGVSIIGKPVIFCSIIDTPLLRGQNPSNFKHEHANETTSCPSQNNSSLWDQSEISLCLCAVNWVYHLTAHRKSPKLHQTTRTYTFKSATGDVFGEALKR